MIRRSSVALFPVTLGAVLRDARRSRGLTLRAVEAASGERLRPSTVAGYERGDRTISVERFCELAALYRSAPEELLARALDLRSPASRRSVVVHLTRLGRLQGEAAKVLAGFVHKVRTRRDDLLSEVITLRSGDLEALAAGSEQALGSFLRALGPALANREDPSTPTHGSISER